ncbi:MAG: hypothetical protein KC877_04765 [Candidatus Kaiserbacteria bacterium]|nr:hypothetical protein [Candidatus Kaiserbacteria bacterium]MCB9815766.1 hypothetical protein [Candidatus Nomurabacteria bacterium]
MKKANSLFTSLYTFALVFGLPVVAAAADFSWTVENLTKFPDLKTLLLGILNVFVVIATPIVVLFIIYSGFLYVTARGNPQQLEQATRSLTYSIIGGILILGAVAFAAILQNLINAFAAP